MKSLKTHLGAITGFAMFVVVIGFSLPQTGHSVPVMPAAGDKDVRVINTTAEAVPVAVQGTPTVTLSSNQVVVARDPFQQFVVAGSFDGSESCDPIDVPAGKQLTIESFSAEGNSQSKPVVYIRTTAAQPNGANLIRSVYLSLESVGPSAFAGDVKTLLQSGATHDSSNYVFSYSACISNPLGHSTELRGLVSGWLQ